MAPKGRGLRQRLGEQASEPAVPDRGSGRGRGRGVRLRVAPPGDALPAGSSSSSSAGTSVKRRLEAADANAADPPLNSLMRKRWAHGVESAGSVLEFCRAAAAQGAAQ